ALSHSCGAMTDTSPDYPRPIEDYALIGDCVTAALVARNGSIDWLCWPRFDSDACLAALLGNENNGHWSIAPAEPVTRVTRQYRDDTMVLETLFETASGVVALIDFMPMLHGQAMLSARTAIVRIVEGRRGNVPMQLHLALRFDFGASVPWVTKLDDGLGISAVAGPHRVCLRSPIETHGEAMATTADFTVSQGQRLPFVLSYGRSHRPVPPEFDAEQSLETTESFWRDWSSRCQYRGRWREAVMRSLLTLKALTFRDTGGIVAAPTTSLPELPGYAGSLPVRIGNAASDQLQLDVYGEVMNALHHARDAGLASIPSAWSLQRNLIEHLEKIWEQPDEGIWEVRGGRRQFTFSKVMAWVAFERAVRDAEKYGLDAPLDRWRGLCEKIHDTICREGFSQKKNAFTQSFGDEELDASLLMMPIVGFLPPDDPRIRSTIAAIERELVVDGFVARYRTESNVDGLPPGEGAFLPCSFWLADNYAMQGRMRE